MSTFNSLSGVPIDLFQYGFPYMYRYKMENIAPVEKIIHKQLQHGFGDKFAIFDNIKYLEKFSINLHSENTNGFLKQVDKN